MNLKIDPKVDLTVDINYLKPDIVIFVYEISKKEFFKYPMRIVIGM